MIPINTIFLIDDDPIFSFLTTTRLKKVLPNTKVYNFTNGQIALTQIQELLPDLILLDLNMPVMDGWQFLDEFIGLSIAKPIPIFVITSSIDDVDTERVSNYPIVKDYIIKPITVDRLAKIVDKEI